MIDLRTKVTTAWRLGITNTLRVSGYRIGIRTGLHSVCRVAHDLPRGPFFEQPVTMGQTVSGIPDVPMPKLFGWYEAGLTREPPDWRLNVLTGQRVPYAEVDWWRVSDFDPAIGDIKGVWEMSRCSWTLVLAQRALLGQSSAIDQLNEWLSDWCTHNPAYKGVNWKCGQEASFRVMHLTVAALLLNQLERPLPALIDLVEAHLKRISPTTSYATGQDNNHGTSEAAALFTAGRWLSKQGLRQGDRWADQGRGLLEERVGHLIGSDGSFSQYSLNYHRVVVDTLVFAEIVRQRLDEARFSDRFYDRASQAANWLSALITPELGHGPNLGANDGARIFPLAATAWEDFRPSAQTASRLFKNERVYAEEGEWDAPLRWLGHTSHDKRSSSPRSNSKIFDEGGFAVLRNEKSLAVVRYPRFRFRPSQADALHVDLWVDGVNHLRDGGTYSYYADRRWLDYFAGTEAHNTIQFDGRDQMPRLGRFLFGKWLVSHDVTPLVEQDGRVSFSVAYTDSYGATHRRRASLGQRDLEVEDEITGDFKFAVLRWRLLPGDWVREENRLASERGTIEINCSGVIGRISLVEGWESIHYGRKTPVPVVEVEVAQPCVLRSNYAAAL